MTSEAQLTARPGRPGRTNPADWTYASGRVSALETGLLGRQFFEGLLRSRDLSEARATLAKTHYRTVFPTDESLAAYDANITGYGRSLVDDILAVSPPHVMADFFRLPGRYHAFRSIFLRKSAHRTSADELQDLLDWLAGSPEGIKALEGHKAMLHSAQPPQDAEATARSLYLDSTVCTLMLAYAGGAREKRLAAVMRDMAVLMAWSAMVRSIWNGARGDVVRGWFLLPAGYEGLVEACAGMADGDPAGAVVGWLSEPAAAVVSRVDRQRVREDIDWVVDQATQPVIRDARNVAFGPEKVLAYLVALRIEEVNLRLALAAVVYGVDRSEAAARLRTEYA